MRYRKSVRENRSIMMDPRHKGTATNAHRLAISAVFCMLSCVLTSGPAVGQPPARLRTAQQVASPAAPLVRDERFHSAALDREMKYRIYLPNNYASTTRRYPVLYLLHGLYGDYKNWDTLTGLAHHAAGMQWIIVMPDAGDSWYTNSATASQDKFEDYITKDMLAEIDSKYRTIRDRHARAIAGLSMGGYGALKFALRNPQSFAFAASLSGALDAARDLDTRLPEFAGKLNEVFGTTGNPAREQNNIFVLLRNASPGTLPYLYLACGTADRFLSVNRQFVAALSQQQVRYEYHETPGNHDWAYWDRAVQPMLEVMDRQVSSRP